MAFCNNCGTQVGDDERFCPNCGQAVQAAPAQASADDDVKANKGISVLSYFGPLVFIPMFTRKNSEYAQFHARQGFTLFVVDVAITIINSLLGLIKVTKTREVWGIPVEYRGTPWFISLICWLLAVGIAVFAIMGLINCLSGKKKELPLIGKLDLWGKFTGK